MNAEWKELYNAARQVLKPRDISRIMEAGGVAAVESASGRIYAGVCVDTACSLGVCAERNAVFSMITNGEDAVKRVIAIDRDGKAVPPCGACREFIAPSMPEDCHATEIMMDCENERTATPGELAPEWWISLYFANSGLSLCQSEAMSCHILARQNKKRPQIANEAACRQTKDEMKEPCRQETLYQNPPLQIHLF
ncbi:cytidine deaminase [uncultured Faecalibaculum sp.]|mgnify:FL=1|uniref:cytidine deaminase family protein n=1 Tax=uncultured Faecalibaculum sp. TaxID=1729681 RepID=UPI0025E40324|nr:hypothetical protein [uncultured Faecalibaculum sp.]